MLLRRIVLHLAKSTGAREVDAISDAIAQARVSVPVYGEQLANLVGHLTDVKAWNPDLLRSALKTRPWFL